MLFLAGNDALQIKFNLDNMPENMQLGLYHVTFVLLVIWFYAYEYVYFLFRCCFVLLYFHCIGYKIMYSFSFTVL